MPLEGFVHFFSFGIVGWRGGRIANDFCPQLLKNSFLQCVCLLLIITQLVKKLACLLPCLGATDKWNLARTFHAGPVKWREKNGAKMTLRLPKTFPTQTSQTKRVKITLPYFSILTDANFEPKRRFRAAFQFSWTRNKWIYHSVHSALYFQPRCALHNAQTPYKFVHTCSPTYRVGSANFSQRKIGHAHDNSADSENFSGASQWSVHAHFIFVSKTIREIRAFFYYDQTTAETSQPQAQPTDDWRAMNRACPRGLKRPLEKFDSARLSRKKKKKWATSWIEESFC